MKVAIAGFGTVGRSVVKLLCEEASGTFELTPADPVEANESHIQTLPRLRFRFDRRSLGRLRQLVDVLNREIE